MLRNLRDLTRRIGAYQVPIYAGNATFFIMLSVFPALMLVFSLLRFTPYTVADFAALMEDVLPGALSPLVTYLTEEVHTLNAGAVIPITAVAMLWSASRGVLGVLNGVNAIYGASETRSYLAKRLIALIYMVLFLVGIVLTLVLYVFGKKIQAMIVARIPALAEATVFIMQFKYVVILRRCARFARLARVFGALHGLRRSLQQLRRRLRQPDDHCSDDGLALFLPVHPVFWRRDEPVPRPAERQPAFAASGPEKKRLNRLWTSGKKFGILFGKEAR